MTSSAVSVKVEQEQKQAYVKPARAYKSGTRHGAPGIILLCILTYVGGMMVESSQF